MAAPVIHHSTTTGAAANPNVLVDGPAWDAAHTVSGLENVPNVDTTNASNLTSGTVPDARMPALTGDVTTAAGAVATTIGAHKVTRAMQAQGVARSVIGVTGNATADVADIQGTASQFLGINSAGTAAAFQTMSGDGTLSGPAITVTKTNSVDFLIQPQVRATLTTGVAVTTADVAGATSIYATVCNGSVVPIYNGSQFLLYALSADLTLALDSNSGHTNYHQSGKNYDLFIINDSGTRRLGSGPKWDDGAVAGSATARGTGAASTDIQLKNGIWTNTNTITIRFGANSGDTVSVAANCATYIGSFRATADGQASDTVLKRLLFNAWQIAPRAGVVQEASVNWTYSTAAFQQANASAGNQVEVLFGLAGVLLDADAFSVVQNSTATARTVVSGIGIDSSTVNSARSQLVQCVSTPITTSESTYRGYPGLGWHEIRWLERGNGTDTQTWYGNNAGAAVHRSGMQLEFWG